jgi:hypothetical protein
MNVFIVQKRKINAKRVAYGHQTFKKKKKILTPLSRLFPQRRKTRRNECS